MSSALFGASGSTRSKNLIEFKAGKMTLNGKMVQPDKRKGLVYVHQSDDSLMHFCWKDRSSGKVEDDLIIFPDDIETKKITQCTTGRVFLMKFKSTNKKFFFWMQEAENEKDKDEKLWKKVNDFLNNPPAPGSNSSSASIGDRGSAAAGLASAFGSADFGGLGGSDLQSLLGSMSEQQLQMFLGGLIPVSGSPSSNRSGSSSLSSNQTSRVQSTTPGSRAEPSSSTSNNAAVSATTTTQNTVSATPATTKPSEVKEEPNSPLAQSQKIQFSDLQNILGNLATSGGSNERSELDLSELVSLDVMAPILANKSIQEKLIQYLPDSDILPKNEKELRTTLTTPQFKKAMSSFGAALQSGQLGPLMKQFDLPESVTIAAAQGNLEAFAKAMDELATFSKIETEPSTSSKSDKEPEVASTETEAELSASAGESSSNDTSASLLTIQTEVDLSKLKLSKRKSQKSEEDDTESSISNKKLRSN